MTNIPKVLHSVVQKDLCIGCGLCVYKCPSKVLEIKWNENGFLIPNLIGNCNSNGDCISVCPFNPVPDQEVKTENELAELFLKESDFHHPKVGKYNGIFAGFANDFRLTSSSGGLATYILTELLEKGIVDHIFSVKESTIPGTYYKYSISSTSKELLTASKTKYFPVTLGTVLPKIHELEGKIAIVGVACFIKAIRLAQHKDPLLREKIPFLVGIICGGVKSRFFTEYLAYKSGVLKENIIKPEYRIKNYASTAGDYSFGCYDKILNKEKTIKMRSVGDMWGTGLFKANACDFCDDVTSELADISLGDAWLPPYNQDGKGTSVIVTRSTIAKDLIYDGIKKGQLTIEKLKLECFLTSQQGSYNHRHLGLSVRLTQAKKQNIHFPPKRFENEKVSIDFKIVQLIRMKVRKKSIEIWKNSYNTINFDKRIKKYLIILIFQTRLYHYLKGVKKKLNKQKEN